MAEPERPPPPAAPRSPSKVLDPAPKTVTSPGGEAQQEAAADILNRLRAGREAQMAKAATMAAKGESEKSATPQTMAAALINAGAASEKVCLRGVDGRWHEAFVLGRIPAKQGIAYVQASFPSANPVGWAHACDAACGLCAAGTAFRDKS